MQQSSNKLITFIFACVLFLMLTSTGYAERIKDIANIQGVRSNPLVGYGLVVGLDGTGEQTTYTIQAFKSMLRQFGITLPPGLKPKLKNIAAVAIHAELPAFAKPGQTIDVTVSSLGDAKSLRGGSLLMTALQGIDGQIYAVAQGDLVVGGFGGSGADGSKITVNIPTVGRIPNGASVERTIANGFASGDHITLNLKRPDFTTAKNLAERINRLVGPRVAVPIDAASVQVSAPRDAAQRVSYLATLENLELQVGVAAAKVVVNSRTGTIVIGKHVKVTESAVAHGSLVVTISENMQVSQPQPFAEGETTVIPQSQINITEENARMFKFDAGVSLDDLVQAVNSVGAAPGDLMAILEALKEAGALQAELVVI